MNYDGKATVINYTFNNFYSNGDGATVIDVSSQYNKDDFFMSNDYVQDSINFLNISYVIDNEFIANNNNSNYDSSSCNVTDNTINKLIPYTIQVYETNKINAINMFNNNKNKNNSYISKVYVLDNKKFSNNHYKSVSVKVSEYIIPTNIFIKETMAYIIDLTQTYIKDTVFAPVFMNIGDKTEFFVPTLSDNFQAMSVVIQKDTFVELNFENTALNVIGLPDGLEFTLGVIKGTISKSGSYDITIQYEKGSQKLNIIVPYYQRLL